ncbi:GumC family protein [Phosphitispora sp. TUW77]|uniref:GumC family protein n=1 Tax=Phosphitispora sp. TUW77 TaxID=3152361 RepID=UPI003AB7E6DE
MEHHREYEELAEIDLIAYVKMLLKWKWLIIGITVLAVITSGILSFFVLSPVYESKTVIMVKEYQDPKSSQTKQQQDDLESVVDTLSRLPVMTIKTYVGQIKNEALMRKVIDVLKLDKAVYTPKSLGGLITVQAVTETNLIELSVKNTDPKLAADIANTLAAEFLDFVGTGNQKQLVRSAEFLNKQLAEKNQELTQAIDKLNQEKSQVRNVEYLEQEVQNKNQVLSIYQNLLLQAEADYDKALAGMTTAEQKLQDTPETITLQKVDLQTGQPYETEEINPAYAELTQLLASRTVELAEHDARKQSISKSVNEIQEDLKLIQTELNKKRQVETQLQEKADQVKQTRDVLEEKLTQVQIAKSVNLGQNSLEVVTPAFPQNSPVSPKKMLNLAIALVLGLVVSVGLAFILELMNNTINKPDDIEQHLGLPILGTIPLAKTQDLN